MLKKKKLSNGDNEFTLTLTSALERFYIELEPNAVVSFNCKKLEIGEHFTGMPVWNEAVEFIKCEKRFKRMRIRKNFWAVKAFSQNGTWEENFPMGSFLKDPSVTYTATSTNNVNITSVQSTKTGVLRIRFVPQSIEAMQYIEIDVTMDAYDY